MEPWEPLQLYSGWFIAYVVLFIGFGVAMTIYQTRRRRLGERILEVAAVLCFGFVFGQAAAFHVGVQADEWAVVGFGVLAAFAVLLVPFVLLERRKQTDEEAATAKARRNAKALHERLHGGADAIRYLECEFCRRESSD